MTFVPSSPYQFLQPLTTLRRPTGMSCPPVLLLIHRRPEFVLRQIDALRKVRPAQVYVAADGPRPGEESDCRAARAAINSIDWPCELHTLYRDQNLGVRLAVSQAITWFFEQVEEGVILEDDCLPDPEFFTFCGAMLERYRNDPQVYHVAGTHFLPDRRQWDEVCTFSKYSIVWGWATWRRAWKRYRGEFEGLGEFLHQADKNHFWANRRERLYWHKIFRANLEGKVNSWAYRWNYTLWVEGALAVSPAGNLVANVGFDERSTNTVRRDRLKTDRPLKAVLGLVPNEVRRDGLADRWIFHHLYWGTTLARLAHRLDQVGQLLTGRLTLGR